MTSSLPLAFMSMAAPVGAANSHPMPVGDIGDSNGATNFTWVQRWAEDFNTDIAVGGFYGQSTGDTGILDPACAAYSAYGSKFKVKTALSNDTSSNAKYHALKTTYTEDSCFIIHDHVDGTDGPISGAIKPLNQSDADTNFMTYGMTKLRWRCVADPTVADGTVVTGTNWGVVSFYISDDAHFPEWSEMDWLEAKTYSANPGGYWHPGGDGINDSYYKAGINKPFWVWHETTIQWMPDPAGARIRWYDKADDTANINCFETTVNTPVSPVKLGWLVQTGSSGGVPTGEAYVQIDWIVIYDYLA